MSMGYSPDEHSFIYICLPTYPQHRVERDARPLIFRITVILNESLFGDRQVARNVAVSIRRRCMFCGPRARFAVRSVRNAISQRYYQLGREIYIHGRGNVAIYIQARMHLRVHFARWLVALWPFPDRVASNDLSRRLLLGRQPPHIDSSDHH
jgi:hypothetical protein